MVDFVDGVSLVVSHVEAGALFQVPGELAEDASVAAPAGGRGGDVEYEDVVWRLSVNVAAREGCNADRDIPELA